MNKDIQEIVTVFRKNIGKPIYSVMERVNITDEDFAAVFTALGNHRSRIMRTATDNTTIITSELVAKIAALKNDLEPLSITMDCDEWHIICGWIESVQREGVFVTDTVKRLAEQLRDNEFPLILTK